MHIFDENFIAGEQTDEDIIENSKTVEENVFYYKEEAQNEKVRPAKKQKTKNKDKKAIEVLQHFFDMSEDTNDHVFDNMYQLEKCVYKCNTERQLLQISCYMYYKTKYIKYV